MGTVISFMNNKGGVAKTLSAFNVGICWANMGKKILFVDLDSQANLTSIISDYDERYIDRPWDGELESAFTVGPKMTSLPIYPSRYENVDFVPSDLKLSNFDSDTSTAALRIYLLRDFIEPVRKKYDFIIIDCPPALGSIIFNAMMASDGLVLVTTPDQPSLDGTKMIVGLRNQVIIDDRMNPNLEIIGCLVTKVKNDTINKLYIDMINNCYKEHVIKPYIKENTRLNQSGSMHKDIFSHDPEGKGARDYKEAAIEILLRVNSLIHK